MRIFATLVDIAMLGVVVYFFSQWNPRASDYASFGLFIVVLIVNLLALYFGKDNWLSLYFKRKALEERKRIESLTEKSGSK